MAGKTGTANLLRRIEMLALECRAWKHIALNFCPNEKPWTLFHDYLDTPGFQSDVSRLFDETRAALQNEDVDTVVYHSLIEALEKVSH